MVLAMVLLCNFSARMYWGRTWLTRERNDWAFKKGFAVRVLSYWIGTCTGCSCLVFKRALKLGGAGKALA
eukprot:7699232-Ditylum_brightwellii.AAC.1